MTDLLQTLLQKLDEPAAKYAELERYYTGTQPLAFLSPEVKTALGDRFGRMASNLPRLAVTSLTERLRVTGFTGVDVWRDWLRNDMDQESASRIARRCCSARATSLCGPTGSASHLLPWNPRSRWPCFATPAPAASRPL